MCITLSIHRTICDNRPPALLDDDGLMAHDPFRAPPACTHRQGTHDGCASHGACCVLSRVRVCTRAAPCGAWRAWHKIVQPDDDWLGRGADEYVRLGVFPDALWEHGDGRVHVLAGHDDGTDGRDDEAGPDCDPWAVRADFFHTAKEMTRAVARLCRLVNAQRRATTAAQRPSRASRHAAIDAVTRLQHQLARLRAAWERGWTAGETGQPFPSATVLERPRGLNVHVQGPGRRLGFSVPALVAELRAGGQAESGHDGPYGPAVTLGRRPGPQPMAHEREPEKSPSSRESKTVRDVARFRALANLNTASRTTACRNLALSSGRRKSNLDTTDNDDFFFHGRVALQDVVEGLLPRRSPHTVSGGRVLAIPMRRADAGRATPQFAVVVGVRDTIELARREWARTISSSSSGSSSSGSEKRSSFVSSLSSDGDSTRRSSMLSSVSSLSSASGRSPKRVSFADRRVDESTSELEASTPSRQNEPAELPVPEPARPTPTRQPIQASSPVEHDSTTTTQALRPKLPRRENPPALRRTAPLPPSQDQRRVRRETAMLGGTQPIAPVFAAAAAAAAPAEHGIESDTRRLLLRLLRRPVASI